MSQQLDLKQLAIDRDDSSPKSAARRPRRWISRFVLPIGVLVGFLILVGIATGLRLMPVQRVSVVPVIVKRASVRQAGQPLFQAPGWIEPRPTPINVPSLTAGVVEKLYVVEGQALEKGQTVAELIPIDAELAVRRAKATLAIREGEYHRAVAERNAAQLRVKKPVHLEVLLADAQGDLATAKSELEQLPHAIRSAEANLTYARQNLTGKRTAGASVSGLVKQRAEADLEDAQAKLLDLTNRTPNLQARVTALERKVDALQEQLELLIEEKRQLEEAKAKVATAAAIRDEAKIRLEEAELMLRRTTIASPARGRVLKLVASPGDRVMGLDTAAEHKSSTIIRMYEPDRLQVRVDVRLEDVPLVMPGQPVEVETAASGDAIQGRVLLPTSSANVQKNTLEVKVELIDPPSGVTPEMLTTVTFLSPETQPSKASSKERERLFVPKELVQRDGDQAAVWVVNASGQAQRTSVDPGTESSDGLLEIKSGLDPTGKLITSPTDELKPGQRVEIDGEDPRLGLAAS